MIRLAACILILTGCGYSGMQLAARFKKRCEQLEDFSEALRQLEFDIDFLNITVRESFEKIAKSSGDGVREVLGYISREMKNSRCCDMQRLWRRAFERFCGELFLTDEDTEILLDFSKNLGSGNRESEKNNIKAAAMRLRIAEDEAREGAAKNMKMYRGLGFLFGVFVVILLI